MIFMRSTGCLVQYWGIPLKPLLSPIYIWDLGLVADKNYEPKVYYDKFSYLMVGINVPMNCSYIRWMSLISLNAVGKKDF